jgi:hypothetical protein
MKNIITIAVFLATAAILLGQVKLKSSKELRLLLRSGGLLPSTTFVNPTNPTKPPKPKAKPKAKPSAQGIHAAWKFKGFPPEVEAYLRKVLLRLKSEAPVHYKMATYRVKTFSWAPKRGSYAVPSANLIVMGERDWKHSKSWFIMGVIHEIQHNNEPGDESEPASCWASWYYGKKLKCSGYQLQYVKALAVKQGYNSTKWDRNIKTTLAENSKH